MSVPSTRRGPRRERARDESELATRRGPRRSSPAGRWIEGLSRPPVMVLTLLVLLGPLAAQAQGWAPFAGAAAFGTTEVTNTRQLSTQGDQIVSERTVEVLEGYTLAVRLGTAYRGAESRTAAVYSVGFSTSGDLELQPENLVQSVRLTDERTLAARWSLEVANELFWGVTRVDQDLGALGLAALPGGGASASAPSTAAPGGDVDPGAVASVDDRFAIHRIRFVRDDARADVTYAPTPRWSHGVGASFRFQTFLDDAIIRDYSLRLFDRYTAEGRYVLGWYPGPWDAAEMQLAAGSTWFGVTDTGAAGANAETDFTATRTGRGELLWRHILTPGWWSVLGGGGTLTLRGDTDESIFSLTGRGGVRYESGGSRYSVEVTRSVESSEQGAVLEVTGLGLGASWRLGRFVVAEASAGGSREIPKIILLRAADDEAAERERLTAWSAAAQARLAFVLGEHVLLVAGYGFDQRIPDAADQTSLSHRLLAGVIVGTGEAGAASAESSDFETFVP